jgi:hypothetical protein
MARNIHVGSDFDDFLEVEGILEETSAIALKRVIAWQLAEAMKQQGVSKVAMAARMGTSRPQVDRILDASAGGMTLETLGRAAEILGLRVRLALEPAKAKPSGLRIGKVAARTPTKKVLAKEKRPAKSTALKPRFSPGRASAGKASMAARKRA